MTEKKEQSKHGKKLLKKKQAITIPPKLAMNTKAFVL